MKVRWSGISAVLLAMAAIIGYKAYLKRATVVANDGVSPRVVLVADLNEADSTDACAEIIQAVRAARQRGIPVQELAADSKSEMLHRYGVLTVPTVLILDHKGEVVSRFEGEDRQTVTAVRSQLEQLH